MDRPSKIVIGNITVDQKYGWDYLWAHCIRSKETTRMVTRPDGVYIERVYRPGDFNWLEIGA